MELTILDFLLTFGVRGDSEVTGKADWGVGGQASDGSPSVESLHSVHNMNRVISRWGSQSPVICASCHSEVTVAGVGPFGVLEGFHEGSFRSSVARTGSPARLALFKTILNSHRVLRTRGRQGTWAPPSHFQSDILFFSYWGL